MADQPREHHENPAVSHEESDVNFWAIIGFAGSLILVAAIVNLLIYVLFGFFNAREGRQTAVDYPLAITQENRLPPEPRLQTNPRQDLADLRAHEDELLRSYGWVDKNAGIVRIPIDAAIKLTLERGLPVRTESKR